MNNLDEQYHNLLEDILDIGVDKMDRTGTGTLSVFGRQITHNMSDGFPLLTTKKVAFKTMMTELKWFLKGDTNIKYLIDNGCNIWTGDAYKNFLKKSVPHDHLETKEEFINKIKTDNTFAKNWGELGPIYGKQWRRWEVQDWDSRTGDITIHRLDQIENLINNLKTNPDSRRLMVNAWNVGELSEMTLPPCHYGFQVYTRELSLSERFTWFGNNGGSYMHHDFIEQEMNEYNVPTRTLSLMWNQRSVDTFLGLPFNIASYGLLLELLAKEVNMAAGGLIGNLGDVHLYKNHVEQAEEQLDQTPFELPKLKLSNVDILNGEFTAELVGYKSHPKIKAPLSN
tara:strand:- start:384 stop:1403 length:1020 start_codon:yes stop_codon:yes gene_type:complete